jgi:outer membrane protein assembly factor BamB
MFDRFLSRWTIGTGLLSVMRFSSQKRSGRFLFECIFPAQAANAQRLKHGIESPLFRILGFALLTILLSVQAGFSQPMRFIAGIEGDEEGTQNQLPFMLPVQPTEIGEAIEDFRRFAGRKQWEKAFKHLEKVFNATSSGLVLTDNGIMLPSRLVAREALLELPPAGHDAYKLFFDAEAKKLFGQAEGAEELNKLTQIFSKYLITSVGDEAANKLGDLHFESGNYAQAIYAWRAILEERPDSRISKGRLRVKIGTALARQRNWREFREIQKLVESQHATEKVTLGGKDVSAVEYLNSLARKASEESAQVVQTPGRLQADLPLKSTTAPLWQFRFFPTVDDGSGNSQPGLRIQQMWGGVMSSDLVPPVVADATHAYVNLLGYDLGIDLKDGKLAWRSGRFFDLVQKAQQGGISSLEQFGVAKGSDRLWSVAIDPKAQNQNQGRGRGGGAKFDLVSRELATGKQVYISSQAADLKDWNLRGKPIVSDDRIYVAAGKVNQERELFVLALNAKDGKLIWSTQIGSYTSEPNYYYYGQQERGTQPSLLMHGDRLYVDSHAGTLIQLESVTGQIEWGLNYISDRQQGNSRFWSPYGMQVDRLTVSPPQMINGVLYVKGMRSTRLYAVDPLRPKVLWHRPVPKTATLIGVDDKRFYLGGEEISAFDLGTRKMLWSVQVNLGTAYASQLMTQNRIYHFSPRGIYEIDKATGELAQIFRGADRDSLGGELIVTPNALLTVSNLAITAYPIREGQPQLPPGQPAAETKNKGVIND